jgi:hypothetical protein
MTAGLFHKHGCWAGTCRPADDSNAKGHFENIPIRTLLIGMHKAIVHKGVLAQKIPGFRDQVLSAIRNDGYHDGPWMWKGSAMYWPAFFEFEPRFVVVERPPEQIFTSCRKSGMFGGNLSDDDLRANISFHQQQMDYLRVYKQAVRVKSFDVMQGDYSSLENALVRCGLQFDEQITADFVDPKLWHYRQSP